MEKLDAKDLTNIVGGLENHVAGMSRDRALEILSELSDDERTYIDEFNQPMNASEFKKYWQESNNTTLLPENNNKQMDLNNK